MVVCLFFNYLRAGSLLFCLVLWCLYTSLYPLLFFSKFHKDQAVLILLQCQGVLRSEGDAGKEMQAVCYPVVLAGASLF